MRESRVERISYSLCRYLRYCSLELLESYTTPEKILVMDTDKLCEVLNKDSRVERGDLMEKLLDALKALSNETRLRILNLLYEKELCVHDIMEILQITQTKTSRHLIYLKNAGLVKDRKYAQWVYYSIFRDEQIKFIDSLVYDNLRNQEPYKNDMEKLNEWLK